MSSQVCSMAKEKMINIILFFFLDLLSSVTYGIKMNRRKIPCYVLETVLQHSVWRMLRAKLPLLKRLLDVESIQKMVVSTCLPCGLVRIWKIPLCVHSFFFIPGTSTISHTDCLKFHLTFLFTNNLELILH